MSVLLGSSLTIGLIYTLRSGRKHHVSMDVLVGTPQAVPSDLPHCAVYQGCLVAIKCSPYEDAVMVTAGNKSGCGQCSADSAAHSSASSSAASMSQSLFISISLYNGLFRINHCRAASTFANQMYWYM